MIHGRAAKVCVAALMAVAAGASAHAFLDHAVPAVGSKVRGPVSEVKIWFTEELEPAFSTVRVEDAKGGAVATAQHAVDTSDRTLLHVPLPALASGKYRVVWRVLSIDSHVTEGDFTFEVAP